MPISARLLSWSSLLILLLASCKKNDNPDPSDTPYEHFQASSLPGNAPRATIVSDPANDRLYFLGGTANSTAISYDYSARSVLRQRDLGLYVNSAQACLGAAGGQRELYVGVSKKIYVLDPLTLMTTDSFQVFPDTVAFFINTIGSNNANLLFISPVNTFSAEDRGIRSFNRLTRSFVAQSQGIDNNVVAYCFQKGNNTAVVSLGNGGNNLPDGISLDLFDAQGNVLSTLSNNQVDNFSASNVSFSGNADFFISGQHVHALSSLGISASLPKSYIATAIDDAGVTIYGLSDTGVDVISYPSLQITKSLPIPEDLAASITDAASAFHLFFDEGKLLIASSVVKSGSTVFRITIFNI